MIQRIIDNLKYIFQPVRKPLLIPHIAASYFGHMIGHDACQKPLRNIDIAVSYDCNLACEHCSCEGMKQKEDTLTSRNYKKLAAEVCELGTIYVAFTGGEPLVNKDLEAIIQIFFPWRNLIGLQTNALLLSKERASSLYKVGVDVLQVSLDSYDPDEHDSFRRMKGAHRETLKNVEIALAQGMKIILCTTVTHSNIRSEGILNIFRFSRQKHIPVVVSIACPVGRWKWNFNELLTNQDRKYFSALQREFPQLRRDFDSNYSKSGCAAGTEKLYITPYGDVIPCPFIHISFGNIKDESLRVIRDRMLKLERFREYNQVCLAGEDKNFFEQYIKPTYDVKDLPQRWEDHPTLSKICQ